MKPSLLKVIGTWLLLFTLVVWAYEAYGAYMMNHTYYYDMFSSTNWWIIVWMIISALIPLWLIYTRRLVKLSSVSLALSIGLLVSWFAHTSLKWWLGWGSGTFFFIFNTVFLTALIGIFISWVYILGAKIYHMIIREPIRQRHDLLLSLWFWIAVFSVFNYLLIFFHLFYPIVARAQLFLMIYLIRQWKEERSLANIIVNDCGKVLFTSSWSRVFFSLLLISIVYFYLGFNLSFIPYSTAWDANHAYMYVPKVMANYHGMMFDGISSWSNIWMAYIAYRFSLMKPLSPWFTLAPDTVAVVMNFLSGPFSLLFGLWALRKVIEYFSPHITDNNKENTSSNANLTFALWWMYLLLWLMSGMWAFLVFVDNKTDLGVMSLTMLALLAGFVFLQHVGNPAEHKTRETWYMKDITRYAIISGMFFAFATMAKPTAFQDILLFGLMLVGLRVWLLWAIWLFLLVIAVLAKAETMSIIYYVSKELATTLGIAGMGALVGQLFLTMKAKSREFGKPLLIRWGSIFLTLLILKWPYLVVQQIVTNTVSPTKFVKHLLMWYIPSQGTLNPTNKQNIWSIRQNFFADTTTGTLIDSGYVASVSVQPTVQPFACSLSSVGRTQDSLYSGMAEIQGWWLVEDFWRYIGFGQRTFTDPSTWTTKERNDYWFIRLWYPLLKLFFHKPGCYGGDEVAKILCQKQDLLTSLQGWEIQTMYATIDQESRWGKMLSGVIWQYTAALQETDQPRRESLIREAQKSLLDYMQSNIVEVKKDWSTVSIAIPYAYLTPINVIFNRSLQNLSSYYTDIWFIWILSLILLLAGLIYTIVTKNHKLLVLHMVTLFWWIVRWFIASGIIWYAVWLIAWTIFSNVLFIARLLHKEKDSDWLSSALTWSIIVVIVFAWFVQTILNLFRIASQGGAGPFVRYKWNTAVDTTFEFSQSGIAQRQTINNNYRAKNVFDLQFGNYNVFLDYVKDRKDEDGVLVAGTYIQYFLDNQRNLFWDGLLTEFWKRWSEGDLCTLALRLKDKKIKYLVIDPNIGTVVMGWGNSTLFDRFFAKVDPKTNKIVQHGTMSLLIKMIQSGYLKLISTNTMWAKYAYAVTDQDMKNAIALVPDQTARTALQTSFDTDPTLFRAKLSVPRFFQAEANNYFILIGILFQQRLSQWVGLEDLADILGKKIDAGKLIAIATKFSQKTITPQEMVGLNTDLTNDEKFVIGYYLSFVQLQQSGKMQDYQQMLNSILQQSLWWGSQLMTFELTI